MASVRQSQRGSLLLLWALTCSTTVLVLIIGYFPLFQNNIASATRAFHLEQAMSLADAGLELALWEIRSNNGAKLSTPLAPWTTPASAPAEAFQECDNLDGVVDYNAATGKPPRVYGTEILSCRKFPAATTAQTVTAGDNYGGPVGDYQVWVINFGTQDMLVVSRGYSPSLANTIGSRTVTVNLEYSVASFENSLFADQEIGIRNEVHVDSYDSSTGAYNPANPGSRGNIGTNGANTNWWQDAWIQDQGVSNPSLGRATVKGQGSVAYGKTFYSDIPTQPTKWWKSRASTKLPHVTVPSDLLSLSYVTPPAGVGSDGNGNYGIPEGLTWTCTSPMKVRSIWIGGTLAVGDGCRLLVDNSTGTKTTAMLDTDMSGKVLKTGTGVTKIYLLDNGFNFDGQGAQWSTMIPESERKPSRFQIYETCSAAPPCPPSGYKYAALAQNAKFYGVVYNENGSVDVARASENGLSYDGNYFGAFYAGQNGQFWSDGLLKVNVHYDEALKDLLMDGSGNSITSLPNRYRIEKNSWNVR